MGEQKKNGSCVGFLAYLIIIIFMGIIAWIIISLAIKFLPKIIVTIIIAFIVIFTLLMLSVIRETAQKLDEEDKKEKYMTSGEWSNAVVEIQKGITNTHKDITNPEDELGSRQSTERESESIAFYNDRFYEEYRPTFRKTVAFTGSNFSEPGVEACAALIISGSVKRGEKIKPNDYYSYFERLYGVVNIQKLHIWLYENGYLRKATPKEALNLYKVPELKTILDSMGLKKNGNKPELIERVVDNIDEETGRKLSNECDRYFRSEKGERFLKENQDYVMYHRNQYGVMFQEFCEHRILYGRKRKFYDTIFNVLSQKASEYQVKGYISQLEWIYHNLSDSLYDEGKYELSLQNALYSLYFSTNLASKYYLFSLGNVKFDGVEAAKSRIIPEETFNPYIIGRILELQPHFREQMLDVVYTPEILPYCLFEKYDILDVVLDLYDNTFDAEQYTNYIRINYGNYIKKFI